jgi:hypothetical protein
MINDTLIDTQADLQQLKVKTQAVKETGIESRSAANLGQFEMSQSHGRRLRRQRRQARSHRSSVGGWVARSW